MLRKARQTILAWNRRQPPVPPCLLRLLQHQCTIIPWFILRMKHFCQHFIWWGAPEQLSTDSGTNLVNEEMATFLKRCGVLTRLSSGQWMGWGRCEDSQENIAGLHPHSQGKLQNRRPVETDPDQEWVADGETERGRTGSTWKSLMPSTPSVAGRQHFNSRQGHGGMEQVGHHSENPSILPVCCKDRQKLPHISP